MSDEDDNETPRPRKDYPLSPAKMSKTPSWIMLGVILGFAAGAVFFRRPAPVTATPPPTPVAEQPVDLGPPRQPGPLSHIEAVFEDWGQYATWADDKTEVALWDLKTERFADFYEVRRINQVYYFRTIPKLTRRVIERGKPMPDCPLKFTETEEQYQEWVEYGRREQPMKRMWEKPKAAVAPANPAPAPIPEIDRSSPINLPAAPKPKLDPSAGGSK